MEYKYEYKDEEERMKIINEHSELVLREEQNIEAGNFLIFVDSNTYQEMLEKQNSNFRISDITTYLSTSDSSTIADIENSILEIEKNKILEGMM